MPLSNMTRWIEDAEARSFYEAAMFARGNVRESHYLHLAETIAKVALVVAPRPNRADYRVWGSIRPDYVRPDP